MMQVLREHAGILRTLALALGVLTIPETAFPQSEVSLETNQLVVMIEGELDGAPTGGAGIIFGRDADQLYVVTANHIVRRGDRAAETVRVLLNQTQDRWLDARLTAHFDPLPAGLDLAVLSVPNLRQEKVNHCALAVDRLGILDSLTRGTAVFPVGYPQGRIRWGQPVTPERIAAVTNNEIQFESFAAVEGYSGGALTSESGQVLGIVQSHDAQFAIAIRIDTVLRVLRGWNLPVELRTPATPSPLFSAVLSGDSKAVSNVLNGPCPNVDERHAGWTPLHVASGRGASAIVGALLRAGANKSLFIDNSDDSAYTALQEAATMGHADVVRQLLEAGADVDQRKDRLRTPLELAVFASPSGLSKLGAIPLEVPGSGFRAIVSDLRKAGAKTEFARQEEPGASAAREMPLHEAARSGNVERARFLIQLGAELNAANSDGETPLLDAVKANGFAMVEFLLGAGANSSGTVKPWSKSLLVAIVECWSDTQCQEQKENAPEQLLKIVRKLIEAGANPDNVGPQSSQTDDPKERRTALGVASGYALPNVIDMLLKAGAKVNVKDGRGRTPLHWAVDCCRGEDDASRAAELRTLTLLLAAGADVNAKDNDADPPLCRALHGTPANSRIKVAEILLKAGARALFMDQCHNHEGRSWAPNEELNQLLRSYGAREGAIK